MGRLLGVYAMISDSFLDESSDPSSLILRLRQPALQSRYLVRDLMNPLELTPRLSIAEAPDLQSVMRSIEEQGLGFVCYTNPDTSQFLGISSNADVRRGILKYFHQLPRLGWQQLCNKEPFTVSPRMGVLDMLRLIQHQSFVVSFVPVVDAAQHLQGSLTFFHLIHSEI